jgi:hypothetical protein
MRTTKTMEKPRIKFICNQPLFDPTEPEEALDRVLQISQVQPLSHSIKHI